MESDLTAVAVSLRKRRERKQDNRGANRVVVTAHEGGRHEQPPQPPPSPQRAAVRPSLVSVPDRTHTLVLKGELHHGSAPALEAEIERLCEEGVTAITLDLRELDYIDQIGIAVIAFRSGLCKRRGHDFAVISGSRVIQRALEQAGVQEAEQTAGTDVMVG
jgi:anti-anti-sigma factor